MFIRCAIHLWRGSLPRICILSARELLSTLYTVPLLARLSFSNSLGLFLYHFLKSSSLTVICFTPFISQSFWKTTTRHHAIAPANNHEQRQHYTRLPPKACIIFNSLRILVYSQKLNKVKRHLLPWWIINLEILE